MPQPRIALTRRGHVWGESWRLAVALAFGLLVWGAVQVELDSEQVTTRFGKDWLLVDLGLGVVATALLHWRRRWPLPVAVVTSVVSAGSTVAIGPSALALVSLATRRRWREVAVVAVPYFLAGFGHEWIFRAQLPPQTLTSVIIGALSLAALVAIGWAIGERRAFVASLHERALTAEREQAMRVVQAQVAERARIAREMHDVLAHRISLVAMHSGALAYRTDLRPEQVTETAEIVRDSANRALTELRAVLGVLRDVPGAGGVDGGAPEPPQPTLDDLGPLVAEAASGGSIVRFDSSGDLSSVPEQVSRNAYRIVQECLTNARKHAPGAPVRLAVSTAPGAGLDDEEVRVSVRNPAALPGARRRTGGTDGIRPGRTEGAGLGLLGLTERAVLAGGELTYGPDRAGDFVVTARLPWSR
ncbi:sensor histidine kinase [Terrabacter sp. AAH1]